MLAFAIPFLSIKIFRTCSFPHLGKYELGLEIPCVKFQVDRIESNNFLKVAPERQNPQKADFDDVAPPLKFFDQLETLHRVFPILIHTLQRVGMNKYEKFEWIKME